MERRKRFTVVEEHGIVEMYKTGNYTHRSLAKLMGVSDYHITRILVRYGATFHDLHDQKAWLGNHRKSLCGRDALLSSATIQEIVEKYKTGDYSARTLSEEYKCSIALISLALRKAGASYHVLRKDPAWREKHNIHARRGHQGKGLRKNKGYILDQYTKYFRTAQDIGNELGVTREAICQYLREVLDPRTVQCLRTLRNRAYSMETVKLINAEVRDMASKSL